MESPGSFGGVAGRRFCCTSMASSMSCLSRSRSASLGAISLKVFARSANSSRLVTGARQARSPWASLPAAAQSAMTGRVTARAPKPASRTAPATASRLTPTSTALMPRVRMRIAVSAESAWRSTASRGTSTSSPAGVSGKGLNTAKYACPSICMGSCSGFLDAMARASRTASPGSAEANGSGVGVVFQLCAASRKLWLPMTSSRPVSPGAACTSSALTPLPQRRDRSLSGSIASKGASMAATPSSLPPAS